MKFIALLLAASTVSADAAKIATGASCAADGAECDTGLCCGTVKDAEGAATPNLVAELLTTFATTCFAKPADAATPGAYEIKAAAVACDGANVPADCGTVVIVAADAIAGTFTCNAAADAAAASYMTVGAAAIIAAATLLQ
jgi:hypothetical protein